MDPRRCLYINKNGIGFTFIAQGGSNEKKKQKED